MENVQVKKVNITKVSNGKSTICDDDLAAEEPLEIRLIYGKINERKKKNISVTMRTPGNDKELGIGFLFTEGIINNSEQVSGVNSEGNILEISLNENETPFLNNSERNFYTTSSCGVCGKSSIDAVRTRSQYKGIKDNICVKGEMLYSLTAKLREQQSVFKSTGGLHASALFEPDGKLLLLREDVGRHNALDKIIGSAFMNNELPVNNKILLLSGRASFELIQKAAMAGIKVIAAVGAPSGLAVDMAKEYDITLIGFLRNERFNIYSGENRIIV